MTLPTVSTVAAPCEGVLGAVGGTPLIRLRRLLPDAGVRLYAKLEGLNPGGSIKDRPAVAIIAAAVDEGRLRPGSVVVESSSGNMGIGLAQACRFHGLRFICVVDSKTTRQNVAVMRSYGAEVVCVTEPDPETGELLQARLARVRNLLAEHSGSFWPNQYANRENSGSHYASTMREVAEALDGEVDYLFLATSTCGTLRGCGEYVRDHGLATRIVAVDAVGSVIFGGDAGQRTIPGLGASVCPPLCDPSLVDECVQVTTADCVDGCRLLVEREAILAGGSSGGVIAALVRLVPRIPTGSTCVAVLPDRGERYLDTIFDDDWVRAHVGLAAQAPEPWTAASLEAALANGVKA